MAFDVLNWHPDLVHFHSVHIPANVALAAHLAGDGVPYCVTVHGALFPAALRRRRLKKAVFGALIERRYLNGALFIHAVSPHEREAIRGHGVDRPIVVVPNGPPPYATVPAARPDAVYEAHPWLRDRFIFMFIGRLEPWQKGLDLLLQAFAEARLNDAALVLVGPDVLGSRRSLSTLGQRLGISSALAFTGAVYGEDTANLIAAADVFVHPSRWEGMSLAVLAAAAAGKPCLLTRDADPFGEFERIQAAWIVEGTVTSVAEGLRRAVTVSRADRQQMGGRARSLAHARFRWPAIAEEMISAYAHALER